MTNGQYGDSEMLAPFDQIAEPISSVTAEGAYDTQDCYDALVKHNAKSIIPPRSNAVLWQDNTIGKIRNDAVQACWD